MALFIAIKNGDWTLRMGAIKYMAAVFSSRLNATWNTIQCKAASFFLFSLRLLIINLAHILSVTRVSIARALFRIRARVALRTLVHSFGLCLWRNMSSIIICCYLYVPLSILTELYYACAWATHEIKNIIHNNIACLHCM